MEKKKLNFDEDWKLLTNKPPLTVKDQEKYLQIFGIPYNPTYDFDLLKVIRQKQFEEKKRVIISKKKNFYLQQTTDLDLKYLYRNWLRKELKVTEIWLNNNIETENKNIELARLGGYEYTENPKIEIENNVIEKYNDYVTGEIEKIKHCLTPQQSTQIPDIDIVDTPEYNTNHFNKNCFSLFNYLIKEYEKEGNVKYINIYYFLKQLAKDQKDTYRFKMKIEDEYKPFIKTNYQITITKFAKAEFAYVDNELPILNDLEKIFRKQLN